MKIDGRTIYAVSLKDTSGRAYFIADSKEQVQAALTRKSKPFVDVWEIDIAPIEMVGDVPLSPPLRRGPDRTA